VRLLLVEDEPSAAQVTAKGLREQAYAVDLALDGRQALEQFLMGSYDAVVLDVMLPVKDGLQVCRTIRRSGSTVPILMLTARDTVESRIEGLEAGADDYLVKPFDFGELVARLRALIRRGHPSPPPEQWQVGRLALDVRARVAQVGGREVSLTAREYALLEYLCRRTGEVVSRDDIAEHVWNEHDEPFSNVVDVLILRLRRKLGRAGCESLIQTRRGEGYRLAVTPNES
jgi:DNA-binding response OmpR family regulator